MHEAYFPQLFATNQVPSIAYRIVSCGIPYMLSRMDVFAVPIVRAKVKKRSQSDGLFLPCFITLILALTSFFTSAFGIGSSIGKLTMAFVVG